MASQPNLYIEGNIDALNLELKYIDLNLRAIMLEADQLYEGYLNGQSSPGPLLHKYKRLLFAVVGLNRFTEDEKQKLHRMLLELRSYLNSYGKVINNNFNKKLEEFIEYWYMRVAIHRLVSKPPEEDYGMDDD